ncbi:MAG: GDSL-like Lipase/Acylhydrolase [Armatimonadetes bacterium]|jgi:lysophospholipase L1-like esterase|nr:GDSL-like Lipase/Acylhydrolase [Armatimonadota bacterium]
MNRREFGLLSFSTLASLYGANQLPRAASAQAGFFFRDGDRVVMIGDSITEQHLHSNYVEIYTLSRNPTWKLAFRNAGIGGDTSAGGNGRTVRDVLSFNPTAVTITFGMNDAGYRVPHDPARLDAYRKGLQGMLAQLKEKSVRTAVLSSSPVEKKEDGRALEGYNQTLEIFAANAKEIAGQNGAAFVDQFHPHVDVLQRARDASPVHRINGGDAVHPGPSGQLLMAWAILKGLGATPLVSSATVDAAAAHCTASSNCTLLAVRKKPAGVSFIRSDRAIPMWIPPAARSILPWAPIVRDLDQYQLQVTGLPAGNYRLLIDDEPCAVIPAAELAAGYNLALLTEGPTARQAQQVHDAVFAKNGYFHDRIFRGIVLNNGVPAADKAGQIEAAMKGMPALEQAVRDALVLRPHRFELIRAA